LTGWKINRQEDGTVRSGRGPGDSSTSYRYNLGDGQEEDLLNGIIIIFCVTKVLFE
jgi:hypothetical protein